MYNNTLIKMGKIMYKYQMNKLKNKVYDKFLYYILIPISGTASEIEEKIDKFQIKYQRKCAGMYLPYDVQEIFMEVLTEVLKKSTGVLWGIYGGLNTISFDETGETIGCMDDNGYFLIDSKFVYERVIVKWREKRRKNTDLSELLEYEEFYEGLFKDKILNNDYFFKRPLYRIRLSEYGEKKWCFCISKEQVGEDTVNWDDI